MQVRKQHKLPEIHYGTKGQFIGPAGDPRTRAFIASHLSKLPISDPNVLVPDESWQPPLFYLTAGVVTQVVPPKPLLVLYMGRVLAILLGAGTVYLCWLATKELAPQAPLWAIVSAAALALLPSFCFGSAHVSNDSAVVLCASAAFYVWIRGLRDPEFDRRLVGAGAILGLAILSKLTAMALIPGLILVILFRMFQVRPSVAGFGNWLKRGGLMIFGSTLSTLVVCGWWFVRNVFTYGEPTGTAETLRSFAGRFPKANFKLPKTIHDLIRYSLENLWGRFGWNDITLSQSVYHVCNVIALVLVIFSVLAAICIFCLWLAGKRPLNLVAWQSASIFSAVGLTLLAGFIQFNKTVAYQPQARYFFIMLLPGALLLTGGLHTFAMRRRWRIAVFALLLSGLASLNILGLVTIIRAGPAIGGVRYYSSRHRRYPALEHLRANPSSAMILFRVWRKSGSRFTDVE
jgi:4-amino-4-deoxy-L-arabinose transferase-like glycosyltransferase